MAKGLLAVGAALVLAIAGLALVVFLNRDEDEIAIDALLSQDITRAFAIADANGPDATVDLAARAPFAWDRLLIVQPGTPVPAITAALGSPYKGQERWDEGPLLIFAKGNRLVRYADYRGDGRFAGIDRPIAELPRDGAVFGVRDLVFTPRPRPSPPSAR